MKGLLFVTTALILSAVSVFTQAELNVAFDMPEKTVAGESFILDIEVDKGDIENFSKLQLDLPSGFTAELIDGKSGTFTFFDQKLKLIWIALPPEPKFNVKIKINTTASLQGSFNFTGKISYVIDGSERKEKQISTPTFNITSTPTAISTPVAANATTTASPELSCTRTLSKENIQINDTVLVTLLIKNSAYSGHGKIIEQIPPGLEVIESNSNGAIFSSGNNQIKFLWMTFPADNSFEISYFLVATAGEEGNKIIDGKVSFPDGEDSKTFLIAESNLLVRDQQSILATAVDTKLKEEDSNTIPTEVEEVGSAAESSEELSTTNETTQTSEQPTETSQTLVSNGNEKVNYRVQICATKKQVNTNYFVSNHKINEKIYADMHQGWHKYTVGKFTIYKEARNHREIIKSTNNITGPFVTAYNEGTRITVQEALMITSDQWMP